MQTEGTTLSSGARVVDVLRVMQVAADTCDAVAVRPGTAADLREARAAVAELVAAATDAHDFAAIAARNSGGELDRRFYRLRAALSRMEPQS